MTVEDREIARTAPAWWTGADVSQTELPPLPPYIYGREAGPNEKLLTLTAAQEYARTALAAERAQVAQPTGSFMTEEQARAFMRKRMTREPSAKDILNCQDIYAALFGNMVPADFTNDTPPIAAERDARRWRELRAHNWFDGPDTLVVTQARNIKLGSDVPSLDRLDAAIDAATEGVQHGEANPNQQEKP